MRWHDLQPTSTILYSHAAFACRTRFCAFTSYMTKVQSISPLEKFKKKLKMLVAEPAAWPYKGGGQGERHTCIPSYARQAHHGSQTQIWLLALTATTTLAGEGNVWLCRCGIPSRWLDHRGEADHRSRLQVWSTAGADCNFYTGCWGEPSSSTSHPEKPVAGMGCTLGSMAQHAVSGLLSSLQQVPLNA